jgi:hypothetical protein
MCYNIVMIKDMDFVYAPNRTGSRRVLSWVYCLAANLRKAVK